MKKILIHLIKGYAFLVSPLLGKNCRFYPTCSSYMMQAIEVHGALKGVWLGLRRLLKCHPYHKGNMDDPVPIKEAKACSSEHCTKTHDQL